ncbi:hypothetical protein [Nitrosomonas ureae]|uniref:hypothetical protein n=1 Tax=Nitrosomonas ureae TaxID=44577 RepID=UPI001C3ED98F|nr:hypothetical protein [Nitrosomonas ureae]
MSGRNGQIEILPSIAMCQMFMLATLKRRLIQVNLRVQTLHYASETRIKPRKWKKAIRRHIKRNGTIRPKRT